MQSVYQACKDDVDRKRISSRSLNRIEEHLTQDGRNNPFAVASRILTTAILDADKTDITIRVQTSIGEIFTKLFLSVYVDDAEAEVRTRMKELLPVQHVELKAIYQDYAAIKAKYEGSQ